MQKKCKKIWSYQKKAVLLHAFSLNPLIGVPRVKLILLWGKRISKRRRH